MKVLFRVMIAAALLLAVLAAGPLAAQEESTAVVATGSLNVRDTPDYLLGRILAKIDRGEAYPVVGRNLEGTWAQLDLGEETGWVNARYVDAPGLEGSPFTVYAAAAGIINARVQTSMLNVRNYPDFFAGEVFEKIPNNSVWPVVGRDLASSWAQLDLGEETGWVNARYLLAPELEAAPLSAQASAENIPIVAQVRTGMLFVRHIPNYLGGKVIAWIRNMKIYPVLGRNFDSSWVQLNINGSPGWVNARYIHAPGLELAPLSLNAFAAEDVLFARVDTGMLNVRAKPIYPAGEIMVQIPRGHVVSVLGRDENGGWLEVDYDHDGEGAIGWVNASYLYAPRMEVAPISLYG